jgi:hypothetical protein
MHVAGILYVRVLSVRYLIWQRIGDAVSKDIKVTSVVPQTQEVI